MTINNIIKNIFKKLQNMILLHLLAKINIGLLVAPF